MLNCWKCRRTIYNDKKRGSNPDGICNTSDCTTECLECLSEKIHHATIYRIAGDKTGAVATTRWPKQRHQSIGTVINILQPASATDTASNVTSSVAGDPVATQRGLIIRRRPNESRMHSHDIWLLDHGLLYTS